MARSHKRSKLLYAAILVACLGLFTALTSPVKAANPTTISFQGKVVNNDGTNVTDGTYSFVFKLYTASSGGSAIWTETDSLSVSAGVFQVNLGNSCPFFTANACNGSTPIDFNANPNIYLGITFNSDPAGEMTPRVQMQSVPFAYNADKVGGLSASQLVQLSPGSQQTGNINVSGTTTSGTSVITPSLTASGALAISSGGANNVTLDSGSTGTAAIDIGGTNATSIALSRTGQTTTVNGALAVDQNATFNSNVIMTFAGTENLAVTSDLAGTVNGISFIGTPSATTGNTNGMFIQQAASANANGLDNALTIDNANSSDVIGAAVNITNTGGGGYTDYVKAPKFVVSGSGEVYGPGYDYFDPAAMTGASVGAGTVGAASGNFGGVASTGAFIDNTDYYNQDFVGSKASLTTNNTAVGDDSKWFYNDNSANNGQVAFSDVSTTGGFARLTTATTTGRGAIVTEGATPGTLDAPLDAANLPIVQMKVRPSVLRITDDFGWGMMDTANAATTNDTLPANGIFFWTNNSTGATGWTGVVRSGSTNVGTVTCPGTITTNFAVGRIIVVNSTTVRFFIDNDATDGVNFSDCGTVTGTLPTASMAMQMYVIHTTTTASTFDMDYARFWQDDSPVAGSSAAGNAAAAEQTQANLSTASDSTASDVTAASVTGSDPNSTSGALAIAADTPSPIAGAAPVSTTPAAGPAPAQTGAASSPQIKLTSSNTFQLTGSSGQQVAVVDNSGNVTYDGGLNATDAALSGGLQVGGDATFAGLSTFQKLATFLDRAIFHGDVEFDGHLTVANDSAGYASLRTGESTVHVKFAKAYAAPPVVTTSISNGQFAESAVSNVTGQGFDISLQKPAIAPTTFSWTAVGVTNPQTAANPVLVPTAAPNSPASN